MDPRETWWGRLVDHEHNECHLYHSFMGTEPDRRIKAIRELHPNTELEHLHVACELVRAHGGREHQEALAPELPAPVTSEPDEG